MKMVELAKQAFHTKNFDLAVEIYERTIAESGPSADLYLGLADSYACAGHFTKAFDVYPNAFRLGLIKPKHLRHLTSALIKTVKQDFVVLDAVMNKINIFTCALCRGLLNDPITIPCGHSFCRTCFDKDKSKICRKCHTAHYSLKLSNIKSNVLISRILEKWFPSESKAVKLKSEGNYYFNIRKFEKAIDLYNAAILLAPKDHLLLSNRSHAYASLDRFAEALQDAYEVVALRPDWPKGYFRKGCALYGLQQYEDAVVTLLQCLALDPSIDSAKDYLQKAFHKILTLLPSSDPKTIALQTRMNPSTLQKLILSNFNSSLLLPNITVNTLIHLKDIITNTVTIATCFAVNNEEVKPDFEKHEAMAVSLRDPKPGTSQEQQEPPIEENVPRCLSAPNSRPVSPLALAGRSRSHSPQNRKRSRNASGTTHGSPISPTSESPFKMQRNNPKHPVDAVPIQAELLNKEDFECSLCYRLLYEPVTTPCGHAFCRSCLDRCLDHQTQCPLCKSSLVEYLAERRQAITESIASMVEVYFTQEFEERKRLHEEEMVELSRMVNEQDEIPIFVCTVAYPSIQCPLHIFEPRYRLMIRQCMESGTRQFGMCVGNGENEEDFSEFGCILEVRDVQFFPDGRSLVDTIGGKRFKVVSKGHKDGYNTAKVEFIMDISIPESEVEVVKKIECDIYSACQKWLDSLPGIQREQILHHLGQFPAMDPEFHHNPSGSAWLWWMVSVLPLDPRIQLTMLAMTSYKERLEGVKKVLQYIARKRNR